MLLTPRAKRIAAGLEVPAERAVAAAARVMNPVDEALDSLNEKFWWGFAAIFDWTEARLIEVYKAARSRRKPTLRHPGVVDDPAPRLTRSRPRPAVFKRR